MATVNQVGVGLSGSSGSGAFAGTTSPVFVTPALGTPSSGTLTNCTGLPVAGGGTGLSAVTAHYLMIGNGTSALTLLAPSATVGLPLLSAGASADPAYGVTPVVGGGTGVNTWTTYSIVFSNTAATTNLVSSPNGVGTSGQYLKSQGASAYPAWSLVDYPTSVTGQLGFIATGGTTDINPAATCVFPTEVWDSSNAYNTGTGEFTVPKAGKWFISGEIVTNSYTVGTGGQQNIQIFKNGGSIAITNTWFSSFTGSSCIAVSGIFDLALNDVITINAFANNGGATTTLNNGVYNFFNGFWLSS